MVMYSIISTPNIILNPMPYYGEDLEWWVQFPRVLAQHFLLLGRGYLYLLMGNTYSGHSYLWRQVISRNSQPECQGQEGY